MATSSNQTNLHGSGDSPELPHITFEIFVASLLHTTLVHLGYEPLPDGTFQKDLVLARQNLDILEILETKTRGNLSGSEEILLNQVLDEVRRRFEELNRVKS